ncbi:hypothetical protein K438DRAFT_1932803 [Mycena galopus ATCC 62051]|nr:hypothetical protein K438DRAFT_1932803 [Mycena galopus ATCC 62051]
MPKTSKTFKRPPAIESAFTRYKNHGAQITLWLIQQAKAHNVPIVGSPDAQYDLKLNEYLTLSRELVLARGIKPPATHKKHLNAIIKLRTRCWKWYNNAMPNQFRNETHMGFIKKMRLVRKIWFNTSLGYDTADSDQDEPAAVLFIGAIGFAGYRDSDTQDDDSGSDRDTEDVGVDDDDLLDLPLSVFQILPDENSEDMDLETAELEDTLWSHFHELQDYRDYLRDLWGERARTRSSSPSLLALFLLTRRMLELASISRSKLVEQYPAVENAEYGAVLWVAVGDDNLNRPVSEVFLEGGRRSFFMVDTWVICSVFLSMTEETVRNRAQDSSSQQDTANHLLMTQLCLLRMTDGSTTANSNDCGGPLRPPLTTVAVLRHQLDRDAIWFDRDAIWLPHRNTRHPLRRLRRMARCITASVQKWLDVHNPAHYRGEASILAQQAHDLLAYTNTIFDAENETILTMNPLARGQQEFMLLEKSWMVGRRLIFNTTTGSRLVTVMFLYNHLRAHADLPEIGILEYLRKFVYSGPFGTLCFSLAAHAPQPLPDRDSLPSASEWAKAYESEIELMALDAFTIERMVLAVLQKLYRSCENFLRPYMIPHEVGDPMNFRIYRCFQAAWNDGTPQTVRRLGAKGRKALQYGLDHVQSVLAYSPELTFLRKDFDYLDREDPLWYLEYMM